MFFWRGLGWQRCRGEGLKEGIGDDFVKSNLRGPSDRFAMLQ
jgi:hypothetical protein